MLINLLIVLNKFFVKYVTVSKLKYYIYSNPNFFNYMCNIIFERYLLAKVYFTKFNGCYALNNLCLLKDTFQTLTNTYLIIMS